MNVWDRVATWAAERRGFHVSQEPPGWVTDIGRGYETETGIEVSEATAMRFLAVYACIRILAESVGSLPLVLYRNLPGGGKVPAYDHSLYPLLHDAANEEQTAMTFRETLQGHLGSWGNGFAEIKWDGGGVVRELWPLRPDRMKVKRENGRLVYRYRRPKAINGKYERNYAPENVLHVPGFGFDGFTGYSPIAFARNAVGLGLAAEKFGSRLFRNDARPGVVLKHPEVLDDEVSARIAKSFVEAHGGLDNVGRPAVLEEGMDLVEVGIPPQDAQFLETRRFQKSEIAMLFRIPPHFLADLERATFSNIEHLGIEFVVHALRPWLVRWEQAITRDLLLPRERGEFKVKFKVEGLLRGDTESRFAAYSTAITNGWMTPNEVRELEDMNPREGGDILWMPLNMVPAEQAVAGLLPSPGMESAGLLAAGLGGNVGAQALETRGLRAVEERRRYQRAFYPQYEEVAARVLRRERQDVTAAARKLLGSRGKTEFMAWLEEFYREHGRFVFSQFETVARAYAELVGGAAHAEVGDEPELTDSEERFVRSYLTTFAVRHCGISETRIGALLLESDPLAAIEAELADWPERRGAETARWESVRFGNGLTKAVYLGAGLLAYKWRTSGKSCPYCEALNGRSVAMGGAFLTVGVDFQPEGAPRPLRPKAEVSHPPAHDGCDCGISAF